MRANVAVPSRAALASVLARAIVSPMASVCASAILPFNIARVRSKAAALSPKTKLLWNGDGTGFRVST